MKILIEESVLRQALVVLEDRAVTDTDCEAITALKQAIKQYEDAKPVKCRYCGQDTMHMGDVCYGCTHPAPAVPEVPDGATHYQPHQKTYYKRVSATEWYLWSCTGKGWIESKGTGDSAEWVMLNPVAAPTPPTNTDELSRNACQLKLIEAARAVVDWYDEYKWIGNKLLDKLIDRLRKALK